MQIKRLLFQTVATSGIAIFAIAAPAVASTITFNTNAANTGFNGTTSKTMNQTSGVAATLTFVPNVNSTTGTPSNVNYGDFLLTCNTCSTQALNTASALFAAFTFELLITDVTDGATGIFAGTSAGGQVFSDVSPIIVSWTPAIMGPGTNGANSGSFNNTTFSINTTTRVVAPSSGTPPGDTTVQGSVTDVSAPEPATFGLIGGSLLAAGLFGRRRLVR